MAAALHTDKQAWLQAVLAGLGLDHAGARCCAAEGSVLLGDVAVLLEQPAYGEDTHWLARAVIGEVPPPTRCEPPCELALQAQAMLCGPHAPTLGLDAASRHLVLACSLDTASLAPEDAVAILRAMHAMTRQWREAMAQMSGKAMAVAS